MPKIKVPQQTSAQETLARQRHEEGIRRSRDRKPATYPVSELETMSEKDKAELHAWNVKEATEEARKARPLTPVPPGMVKAVPGGMSAVTERLTAASAEVEEDNAKALAEDTEELNKHTKAANQSSKALAEQTKAFKLLSENTNLALGSTKVPSKKQGMFSAKGLLEKVGINDSGMVGGMLHKMAGNREEQSQFLKQHPELGKSDFKKMKVEEKNLSKLVAKRNDLMGGSYGLSEEAMTKHHSKLQEDIAASQEKLIGTKVKPGLTPGLEAKIEDNKTRYGEYDTDEPKARAKLGRKGLANVTASTSSAAAEEATIDQNKMIEEQTGLLKEIRDNTGGKKAERKEGTGNKFADGIEAIGKGIAGAMKALGGGFKALGAGIGKGFELAGKGIGKGMEGLLSGLGKGVVALGKACTALVNPMVMAGLAIFTLTIMGIATALRIAAPAIEAFVPVLLKVVDVIGNVFMKALEMIPDTLRAIGGVISDIGGVIVKVITAIADGIGSVISAIAEGMETLSKLDAGNLAKVGFAMIPVATGIGLVAGAGVAAAAAGTLAAGLNKVTDFVTGPKSATQQSANQITAKSEENASNRNGQSSSSATTVVSAPTVNNKTNVIQPRRSALNTDGAIRGSNGLLPSIQ